MIRSVCLLLLLLGLGACPPVFGDDPPPKKSILLVAKKNLPDPFFNDAVVLVTNHAGRVPVGVIINRPTDTPLSRIFTDIERLRTRDQTLFFGGPVKRDELVVLFRASTPPKHAIEVLEGVYMSANRELVRELLGRANSVDVLRVFGGHASWAPGQLEAEIARGSWHLAAADAGAVFNKSPKTLWQELERRATAITAWLSIESVPP